MAKALLVSAFTGVAGLSFGDELRWTDFTIFEYVVADTKLTKIHSLFAEKGVTN